MSTPNLAHAPISGTNSLYATTGVDFIHYPDIAAGLDTTGEGQFVEWVEYQGDVEFDEDAADQILRDAGFRRVGPWDYALNDYAQANIEAL